MKLIYLFFNILQSNTAYTAYCFCKVFIDDIIINTDCFKNLSSLIRLNGRNTHLGSNFYNTVKYCIVIIIDRCIIIFIKHSVLNQFFDGFLC